MDFSVLGFHAEAVAIPVLYVETGLNPTCTRPQRKPLSSQGHCIGTEQ